MYRWIIGGILAALILLIVISGHGATKTAYVNGLPLYSSIPGREYIFERDCYIFKLTGSASDWPYVGTHATVPELPADFDPKKAETDLPGVRILDTVTVGTHFRIVSVRRDQKDGKTNITYEILLADEATRKYPRVDALYMLDRTSEDPVSPPSIMVDYAVPRRSN
jgi:hypothetical protein